MRHEPAVEEEMISWRVLAGFTGGRIRGRTPELKLQVRILGFGWGAWKREPVAAAIPMLVNLHGIRVG